MVWDAKCTSTARLNGKTAVVTGCNTGIGKFTVMDFYKRGARVIMACRSIVKAEEAAANIKKECEGQENLGEIKIVELDLGSLKSVRECAQKLLNEESEINLLVNNAGIMITPEGKTEDGFETQMGTNHFGHFLLTLLLLPKIIKSAPARIVNLSSAAHTFLSGNFDLQDLNWESRPYNTIQAYAQSKVANILFTKELAKRLNDAGIEGVTTYSLHPGAVATELQRHTADSLCPAADWIQKYLMRPFFKTPEQGAQTTIYCSVDKKCANETGLYYAECKPKSASSKASNMDDAKSLWDISFKMVGFEAAYNPFGTKL